MDRSYRRPPKWSAYLTTSILAILAFNPAQALHFYLDAGSGSPKCFYEELPKDTLVVGHYTALHHSAHSDTYESNPELGITVTVEETFDNDHRVVNTRGAGTGTFTFSAADSGDHRICFTPHGTSHGGWLSGGGALHGNVKLNLDLAVGETSAINDADKGKVSEIAQKVRDLNGRLQDIRREQVFQREREAEFRDQSESTNARVVRWTVMQLIVLAATCAWQLSHLRAFFIKQKLT